MIDPTIPTPDAVEQNETPPLPDDLSHFVQVEDETLQALIHRAGLFMNVPQLRLCLTQLKGANETPRMSVVQLLDALCELYATRPETQTLMGLDTDDPNHADALSALICYCRDTAARRTTPPLQLHTVLSAIHRDIAAKLPPPAYDRDASLHFTLCDAATAATLPARGYAPTASMYVAGSAWQLLCHESYQARKDTRRRPTDRLCFVYTTNEQPTPKQCQAASTLMTLGQEQHIIHDVHPVPPHMLLPVALSLTGGGLTIDTSRLSFGDPTTPAEPCDLVRATPGGWLLTVAADRLEELQQLAASFPLTIAPFATLRKERTVELACANRPTPVRISTDLLRSMEFSLSYRLTDNRPHAAEPPSEPVRTTPLLLHRLSTDAYGQLADEQGCDAWFVRALTLPLDQDYRPQAFANAISALQQALCEDGCTDLSDAALLCGLEISPTLPRTALWQNVLQLHHTLSERPMHILPIALQHTEQAGSQCVLCMVCHKPQPDPQGAPHNVKASPLSNKLPLPAECSLLHTEQPEALIVHAASAPAGGLAATLSEAGANVQTLRLDGSERCATVLADAIHAARLVLFVGADEHLERALAHRRVQYALVSLVERDGLCLAQGKAMCPVCRTGLFDAILPELPVGATVDAFASAFPFTVSYVRDLDRPDDEPTLRPLPDELMLLREDIPVGDPMVELFRTPDATERSILAITDTQDGTPAAVRLSAAGGHLIAFADGFTPDQLRQAVQYFR